MANIAALVQSKLINYIKEKNPLFPWWDDLKVYCTYGLVTLGMITIPTSLALGNGMACERCGNFSDCENVDKDIQEDYNLFWANNHCSLNASDYFVQYFALILVFMAFSIILVDEVVMTLLHCKNDLKHMHEIVKDTESEESDNKKTVEMFETFSSDRGSYFLPAYVLKTLFEGLISIGLLVIIVNFGLMAEHSKTTQCTIAKTDFLCETHRVIFYRVVMYIAAILLCINILCAFGPLIWIFPCFGKLSKNMNHLKSTLTDLKKKETNAYNLDVEDYYFNDKNSKLLFDILAETNGIEVCFQIFCLMDNQMYEICQVQNINVSQKGKNVVVRFDGAPAFKYLDGVSCKYIVEISPEVPSASVKVLKGEMETEKDEESGIQLRRSQELETTFKNLVSGQDYTFTVQSLINGKTVAEHSCHFQLRSASMKSTGSSFRNTLV